MAGVKTALSCSAYSLDAQSYLGELVVFGMALEATDAERHGLAATSAYTQVLKKSGVHRFELVKDNSGPALSNLDVSVWNPDGADLLGTLKSGSVKLKIPTADGSGLADVFTYGNVVGARRIEIDAEMLIPTGSSTSAQLVDARSATVADWTMASVLLTFGTGMVFDLPMVLGSVDHGFQRDGMQTVRVNYKLRGTPGTVPTAITLYSTAFSGDMTISLSANTGAGTWSGTGMVSSLDLSFADGQLLKVSGELAMQGQPGYS